MIPGLLSCNNTQTMLDRIDHITNLIGKYFRKELTPDEAALLEEWLSEHEDNRKLLAMLTNEDALAARMSAYTEFECPDMLEKISAQLDAEAPVAPKAKRFTLKKVMTIGGIIAAAILVVYFCATLLSPGKPADIPKVVETKVKSTPVNDTIVYPVAKAMLILANGDTILLDENGDGPIGVQGAFNVSRYSSELRYEANGAVDAMEDLYNTIITPRGAQFKILLPDRTIIMLNVASSIRLKISPGKPIRNIDVTGEAYFDIARNPGNPFIAEIPSSEPGGSTGKVEVIGTQFNINTYDDSDLRKVTLLGGGLIVSTQGEQGIIGLAVGQQAQIPEKGKIKIEKHIDTANISLWRMRSLKFNEMPIQEVLKKLENWYDVKLSEETKKLKACAFTGDIIPGVNIDAVVGAMNDHCEGLNLSYDSTARMLVIKP